MLAVDGDDDKSMLATHYNDVLGIFAVNNTVVENHACRFTQ